MDQSRLTNCARCNVHLQTGASRCNECNQWLCDPCVNQHRCEKTPDFQFENLPEPPRSPFKPILDDDHSGPFPAKPDDEIILHNDKLYLDSDETSNSKPEFVTPPKPNTTEELARFVVDAIRGGHFSAGRIKKHYAELFGQSVSTAVLERATQFARRHGWTRFQNNRWHLDRPPGSVEGLRITFVCELKVDDLAHYNAESIEGAAQLTQHQLDRGEISPTELLDMAHRLVEANVQGRRDLLPFEEGAETTGANENQREPTVPNETQRDVTERNETIQPSSH